MKKTKLGQELIKGLSEAVAFERGEKKLRTSQLEIPQPAKHWRKEEIARLRRDRFQVSQPVFASLLSVTASTVRAWEQGLKKPSGAASRLLELAALDPNVFSTTCSTTIIACMQASKLTVGAIGVGLPPSDLQANASNESAFR